MKKQPASIFNDVIGPIMRGPSSSHTAAAARIGKLARLMLNGNIKKVLVEFNKTGSLATTYQSQGSDIGLIGGLLGFEPHDDRLVKSLLLARDKNIDVSFQVIDYQASHPNTYRITLTNDKNELLKTTAISTGGGMILFEKYNGFNVHIAGDFFEALILAKNENLASKIIDYVNSIYSPDVILKEAKGDEWLVNIKGSKKIPVNILKAIENMSGVNRVISLTPVLPIISNKKTEVPFITIDKMLNIASEKGFKLWEMAVLYESSRGKLSSDEVFNRMKSIVTLMSKSIKQGLDGTYYNDRILGCQSHKIKEAQSNNRLVPGNVMNTVISYITSLMEVKSAMGVIIAAPTAGSCGALPGTIIGVADEMSLSVDDATKAMLAAGIIGLFIAQKATFAAEVGGCQVECGAGSAMAAAGLTELLGGSAIEAVDAASMALQNIMGMVCDPVAERVEVPCLGKNVMAGVNAISCANMTLAGYDKVIPLDEVIDAMYEVGQMLPPELRCTGKGGLSVTKTALKIKRGLINKSG